MQNILPKQIVDEWGLGGLPEIKQVEMVDRLGRLLYQALLVRSLDILSDNEQEEFDKILDKDTATPQEVLGFLAAKIPTFEEMRKEEVNKLKESMLIPTV